MRKTLFLCVVILVVVALPAVMLGCGKDNASTTVSTPEGDLNIQGGGQAPTEAQLGISIYPGAQYVAGSGGSYSLNDSSGTSGASGSWTTQDSFDKVVNYYTGLLGAPITSSDEQGQVAVWLKSTDSSITTVTAKENSPSGGQVTIEIGMMTGSGLPGIPGP